MGSEKRTYGNTKENIYEMRLDHKALMYTVAARMNAHTHTHTLSA